ncbi:type VI secretion system lipoprotein TssJ [Comamonas sp. NoAH]|uniref:type VI secretion system lipoprotein TssJ n=1 Tax=Comamonas halotolerans TaxID=3041496 RepID=UPI0024E060FA|nr:type VI secretion system lipoprotein TssJ [Comamonas sp. NoAH]
MKKTAHLLTIASISTALLTGCSTPVAAVGSAALKIMGIAQTEVPEEQKPPRPIPLQIQAGNNLNSDEKQRAQAVVVRIYHLKDANAFWLAPYDAFIQPDKDRELLANNLVAVEEVTLSPGQSYDVITKVPRQAKYVGIVTLFYSPSPQRWRIIFDAEKSEKTGILVGIHSCAMTATRGSIQASQSPNQKLQANTDWKSLLSVKCPSTS